MVTSSDPKEQLNQVFRNVDFTANKHADVAHARYLYDQLQKTTRYTLDAPLRRALFSLRYPTTVLGRRQPLGADCASAWKPSVNIFPSDEIRQKFQKSVFLIENFFKRYDPNRNKCAQKYPLDKLFVRAKSKKK